MPGPLPSADRQARPGRDIPWVDLPEAGRAGSPPAVPPHVTLLEAGQSWWVLAWKTPESTQWGAAELLIAARRAELEDLWQADADSKLLGEMRHLESALCMTPKARKEARWRIAPAEVAAPKKAKPRSKSTADLRVVDGQAS